MNKQLLIAASFAATLLPASVSLADVDPGLPDYQKASGVSGNVNSVGSDTLANLMTLWSEEFNKQYPNVNIQVQAAGSSTAPVALIEGTSNLGPMSRKMKDSEIAEFEKRFGYKPTAIGVAIDALNVYVHKDNPIAEKGLSLAQVDAIFSATRSCGYKENITKWGQLGLDGEWADRDIQLFGRNSVSGTYGFFKENALCGGDFKDTVAEQPGSASVVQGVTKSLNAIGYSGIGYLTSGVKGVALAREDGGKAIAPNPETAADGSFPLARFLYIYVNKAPNKELDPLVREYIKLIMSKEGQMVVVKDGYVPLPVSAAKRELAKVGIELDSVASNE